MATTKKDDDKAKTADERIDEIVELLRANGMSIPKSLEK